MKQTLTQAFVKRVECDKDKTKQEFYDKEITGFLLEVRLSGAKNYYVKTTVDAKRKSKKIGDAKVLDIQSARVKAIKLKRAMEEQKDILIGNKNKPTTITLGRFYEQYDAILCTNDVV